LRPRVIIVLLSLALLGAACVVVWARWDREADRGVDATSERSRGAQDAAHEQADSRRGPRPSLRLGESGVTSQDVTTQEEVDEFTKGMSPQQVEESVVHQGIAVVELLGRILEEEGDNPEWTFMSERAVNDFLEQRGFKDAQLVATDCGVTICELDFRFTDKSAKDDFVRNGGLSGVEWGENMIIFKEEEGGAFIKLFFHNEHFSSKKLDTRFRKEQGVPLILGKTG
jgi:hypothetical protein